MTPQRDPEQWVAALRNLEVLHRNDGGHCCYCGESWPCLHKATLSLHAAVDTLALAAPEPPLSEIPEASNTGWADRPTGQHRDFALAPEPPVDVLALREALVKALAIQLLDVFMCDHQAAYDCAEDMADALLPVIRAEAERIAAIAREYDALEEKR